MPQWVILLLVFPAVCALIGWITNVLAVKMIFRPHDRVRVLGVAFQGVLPKHQRHFAAELAKVIHRDFIQTDDLVRVLEDPKVQDEVEVLARELWTRVVEDLKEALEPSRRTLLSPPFVEALLGQITREVRQLTPRLVEELRARSAEAFDLQAYVTQKVVDLGPRGLEQVIYEVSRRELVFIEYYGGIFGALLGLVQWGVLQVIGDSALPIVGAAVGTVTNWLAIQMLFYPREATRYLGLVEYQGMFPKRQQEIAGNLGTVAARDLIRPAEIFDTLFDRVVPNAVAPEHLALAEATVRDRWPPVAQMLDRMLTEDERDALRQRALERLPAYLPEARAAFVDLAARNIEVEAMISDKVRGLDKSAFEGLLRGLFEREEVYLIIYGGLLGGLIGFLQLLIVDLVA